jgi:transglutaminase-like putative cysteine protease
VTARRLAFLLATLALAGSSYARVNIPPWVRAAIPAEVPAEKDTVAVVLLDDTAVTVNPDGVMSTRYRRVVKILNNDGKGYGVATAWIDHDTKLRELHAWSIDSTGGEYEVRERDAIETTPTDFELYTDARMKVLSIPAANPGSIVAYEVEMTDVPTLPQTAWHFQEDVPVLLARFQLVLPQGWTYDARWMNYTKAEPSSPGLWELRSIPAIKDEPRRPATMTLAGRIGFNFLRPAAKSLAWSDIGKWYLGLALPRNAATPQLQAKVKELTAGAADPMRPLARFAQRDVRYVAVEIGIGGYQPHAAGEIFSNRFGDCKDKATLLRTMLKEIGVDAYYVLVNATRGVTDPAFPSMYAFNHVIAAIPISADKAKGLHAVIDHPKLGKLLLFDPTSTLTPYGELPESLQASRGLLVTADGGEMIELPQLPPEASQLRRVAKLQLDSKGTLTGMVEEVRTGSVAVSMRASLQALNAVERVHMIETNLASHLTASTAADVTIEHLDDPEADLVIRYRLAAPFYAKRTAGMIIIRPRVVGAKADRLLDPKRLYAYQTDGPSLHTDEVEIRMPEALTLDELPSKVEIDNPFVHYSAGSTFDAGVLHYKRQYALKAFMVPLASQPELNSAWKQVLADERASAVFK